VVFHVRLSVFLWAVKLGSFRELAGRSAGNSGWPEKEMGGVETKAILPGLGFLGFGLG
jgi:hypothetical protein